MKLCTKCGLDKPTTNFYARSDTKHKIFSWCKSCHSRTYFERKKQNPQAYYESRMKAHYKSKYGLALADVQQLYDKQKGQCAICRHKTERLEIDHCHTTGKIRGMLCHQCNSAIGHLGDSTHQIIRALFYLLGKREINGSEWA